MMNTNKKQVFITSFVLLPVAVLSYVRFTTYKPKILTEVAEVKGAYIDNLANFPLPDKFSNLSIAKTSYGRQFTFIISKSPQDIQKFYKNILISERWKLDYEFDATALTSTKYKKDKKQISITSSPYEDSTVTIVNIDIVEKS